MKEKLHHRKTKENHRPISLMNIDAKNPQQNSEQTEFNNILKGSLTTINYNLVYECKDGSETTTQLMRHTLTKRRAKTIWSISTDEGKAFDSTTTIHDKNPQQNECRGNISQKN